MGKLEVTMKSEIERLAKREVRKVSVPLKREVWSMKGILSQIRRSVSILQRFMSQQESQVRSKPVAHASPEEIKKARFSSRLIKALRKHLGVSQKGMAVLAGVTVGTVFQWEKGIFEPKDEKKKILLGLRKLGRREAKALLKERREQPVREKKAAARRKRSRKKASKK